MAMQGMQYVIIEEGHLKVARRSNYLNKPSLFSHLSIRVLWGTLRKE